jgi:PAS domain S-box-containing protein
VSAGSPPPDAFLAVRAVSDRLMSPLAIVGPDSTLRYINPAGATVLGVGSARLVGRHMLELIHPDDRDRIAEELRRVVDGASEGGTTTYRLRADGGRGEPSSRWSATCSTTQTSPGSSCRVGT